jgi:Flp pilus assembly protein TadD
VADLEAVRGNQVENGGPEQTDREYAKAFVACGLDLDAMDPTQAGKSLAGSPATAEIAAAIDHWCAIRRRGNRPSWRRLADVARAADPDPWRNTLRGLYDKPAAQSLGLLKAQASDAAALARQPADSLLLFADMLDRAGDRDGSANVLRGAWRRFPSDFWVNLELGSCSWTSSALDGGHFERPDEAMRFCSAAVAIRPGSALAFNMLGVALSKKGDVDGANVAYREAVRLRPDYPVYHANLGYSLLEGKARSDEAIAEFRHALRLRPDYSYALEGLARALEAKSQLDDAIIAYRQAVRLKPDDPIAFNTLLDSLIVQKN